MHRLLNCSQDLPVGLKQEIFSRFAQKLLNSKHSVGSSKLILVHSVTKYVEMCRRSQLPIDHCEHKPLHFDRLYKKDERRIKKFLAAANRYRGEDVKYNWRNNRPTEWKGSKSIQFKLP